MSQQDESCAKKISECVSDYTENSNLHGVAYIGDRERHWFERFYLIFTKYADNFNVSYSD